MYSLRLELNDAGLNPCYSGICSVSVNNILDQLIESSLNPCYSGICSVRFSEI